MAIYQLNDTSPNLAGSAWVAPSADIIGDVRLAQHASVWFNAVLRGDNDPIIIGAGSNIQDGCVLHTDMGAPVTLGAQVTVGHKAMLHGCTVGNNSLIGINAVVLNHACIGNNCLVGAGALVTENKQFPDDCLILGSPAKVVRNLTDAEIAALHDSAQHYIEKAQRYRTGLVRI